MSDKEVPEVPKGAKRSWHEMIEVPNELAKKVPVTGGKDPAKAFKEAEDIVKKMASEYVDKLGEDIRDIKILSREYGASHSAEALDDIFKLVHNMRGQGATFGFPLITEIGRSFCRYVRELPAQKDVKPAIVDQHLKALQVVYEQSIKGGGDSVSQEVVRALATIVDRELS